MKLYELRQLTDQEVKTHIEEEQNNLLDLRFAHSLKQLSNTSKINAAKKTIARLNTLMQERASNQSSTN